MSDEKKDAIFETTRFPARLAQALASPRSSERRLSLLLYQEESAVMAPLPTGVPVVVGRLPPSDVVVLDESLSRTHARFTREGDRVLVEDLESTNGTFLRGERLARRHVEAGEEIVLGRVTAVVHALAAEAGLEGGVLGHDRFRAVLEDEVVRARFFGRKLGLVMIKMPVGAPGSLGDALRAVSPLFRRVDRIGVYGNGVLEALVPEADAALVLAIGQNVNATESRFLSGFAIFPDSASSAEELSTCALAALQRATPASPVAAHRAHETTQDTSSASFGTEARSRAMRGVLETAARIARGTIPVLIHGETGSGKEVLARFIHASSPRASGPMVSVNCGAIPAQLVESTLFGHEKGAFTGADQLRKGLFEAASGGTLLLDEIGELAQVAQIALLRVLESKRVVRVGSTREIPVDVRVIAASHRDLESMVTGDRFREDLLYRLNALTLEMPPLRERKEDIKPLAESFLRDANRASQSAVEGFSDEALELLANHAWPGNVRELRNAVERATIISKGRLVDAEDLPERLRPDRGLLSADAFREESDFRMKMLKVEGELLLSTLTETDWNRNEAARRLKMPLRTLNHKLKMLGLKKP